MNKPLAITAFVDAETLALVEQAALARGDSVEDFAAAAIREAAYYESAEFEAFLEEGERDIAEGRFYTQADMDVWFAERIAAAEACSAERKGAA